MVRAIDAAVRAWSDDPAVALVLIDAEGPRAFSAGGDIADVYRSGRRGDFDDGRRFWADEYRMNARIAASPKPCVALMQGFVMGGGVGVSGHGSHRIVGETTRVAMPECMIGLIPDVGATSLLARAPGRLGEYLGVTGHRMGPGDAIHAGFADHFVPEPRWPDLAAALTDTGDPAAIAGFAEPTPAATLPALQEVIDDAFEAADLAALTARLETSDWGHGILKTLRRQCPLSMACTLELVRAARRDPGVRKASPASTASPPAPAPTASSSKASAPPSSTRTAPRSGATTWTASAPRRSPPCWRRWARASSGSEACATDPIRPVRRCAGLGCACSPRQLCATAGREQPGGWS